LFLKIIAYYDVKTDFRRAHDIKDNINEFELIDSIKDTVKSNMKYANSSIISSYYELNRYEYYEDFSGFAEEIYFINLCHVLLDEMYVYVKEEKILGSQHITLFNS
jgi:hypothetical protein